MPTATRRPATTRTAEAVSPHALPTGVQPTPGWDEAHRWEDPERCPFCGAGLVDGGAGFIDHIGASDDCSDAFEDWREGIVDDIGGEWTG